jgi:uncharacterized protein (DUF2141 family)
MRRLNPVTILITLTGLAASVLLYLDSRSTPVVAGDSGPLAAVKPLPGYTETSKDQFSLSANETETTMQANLESKLPDVPAPVPADESTQTVSIHVFGLKPHSSNLYVAVFDSEGGFPKPEHSRTTTTIPVDAESVEFSLSLPGTSTTGIAIFQDLNGDGKLTKNGFGLPTEPYGFSNNARSTFGPPSFSQAAFKVSEKTSPIKITVR